MDVTALGIVAGVVLVFVFACINARKSQGFDAGNSFLVFGASFAIITGVQLLQAAYIGNERNLPRDWRTYLGAASIIGIGLSVDFLIKAFRSALSVPATPEAAPSGESADNKNADRNK